ncbi:hypothetical protein ANN_01278 [Periplaneta americana]|uniref:Uncharacterized protein n=1 Tax=Periplaneta americana TaxID=6978 RepID=A0ABQ8TUX1_PERAM|nr:hypothetical protein ANN_01278 [Periplaneta americana]
MTVQHDARITSSLSPCYKKLLRPTVRHVAYSNQELVEVHFIYGKADGNAALARRLYQVRYSERWIGRGSPIPWPPRSPDLNPIYFYLWGNLKSFVYWSPVPDMESLRNRIVAGCEEIRNTPGILDCVRRAMRHRCGAYIQAGGAEIWTLRRSEEKRVEAFETRIWRRMECVKWTDTVRNEAVLERVHEERMMLKLIRKRKRNWLGHWLRRNCLLKDALEGMVNGRRVRARKRYQMIEDIKIYRSCAETKRKDWRMLGLQ